MKNVLMLLMVAVLVASVASISAQSKETLKQKATRLMNSVEGAVPVEPADNILGLRLDSIAKSDAGYNVYLKCTNPNAKNADIGMILATVFVDPENYRNIGLPYTIDEQGFRHFSITSLNGADIIPSTLKPASNVMYVYFKGVTKPEELRTVPLFFTVVLDDNPFVLEQTPRHAGTTFDNIQ